MSNPRHDKKKLSKHKREKSDVTSKSKGKWSIASMATTNKISDFSQSNSSSDSDPDNHVSMVVSRRSHALALISTRMLSLLILVLLSI